MPSRHWWVQWAALGIGIAWFVSLFRVIQAAIVMVGLTALAVYVLHLQRAGGQAPGASRRF
jgi:hypothetical protein